MAVAVAVTASAAASARAEEPRADVEGVSDAALRDLIIQAIGVTPAPAASRFEGRRRAATASDNAIAVLRSEGYYAYIVNPDLTESDPPRPVVKIEAGPRFVFADAKVQWTGTAPNVEAWTAANSALGLEAGSPGRAAAVLAAEGRVVAALQEHGYADVRAEPREVIVDHADSTVRPTFHIASGALVRLDGLNLAGEGRTNPGWLARLTPWTAGDVYRPALVGELEQRLRDTGVYDSVTVALQDVDKATPDGLRPVLVSLSDRARRTVELGAGYSTSEGLGVDGRLIRYNRLRRADTQTLTARLAEIDSKLDAEIALPHWLRAQQTLKVGGGVYSTKTDAYDETGAGVRADVTRRYGRSNSVTSLGAPASYLTVGASLDLTRTTDTTVANPTGRERDLATLTTLGAFAWDASNNPLDPSRGWRLEARGEPTLTLGDSQLVYFRTSGQGTVYFPFGAQDQTVLAGRVRIGTIIGGSVAEIPAARRFYSGGGGSVRGYAYQAIGPRLSDNTPQGGVSLFEGSIEARHKFTQQWGGVAFIDAGAVSPYRTPSAGDVSLGAGFGVRYDLGFGPIRADIAFPLNKRQGDPAFQVYISIGQSF
jgi:translocation and assembly module TamA